MVIKRNWKIASHPSDNCPTSTNNSSSDDSNSSWKTISTSSSASRKTMSASASMGASSVNTVTTVTATVKSHISNPQMAESVHRALKSRLNGRAYSTQSNTEAAIRSMELMRINIQEVFNQEIDAVVNKYVESFFKPALNNIKENLGQSCLSDDVIQKIICTMLDNCKSQYGFVHTESIVKSEPTFELPQMIPRAAFKRKLPEESTTPTTVYQEYSPASKVNPSTSRPTPANRTKQVYWNVSQLNSETRFVLDYKANRALGFADNSKERLASKHPELIRYLPDTVDKEWMFQQHLISASMKSNRFLLLVHGEVLKVARTDAYRTTAKLNELDSFRIPEFMLQKMKIFFTELSLRSQSFVVQPGPAATQPTSDAAAAAAVAATNPQTATVSTNAGGHFSGSPMTSSSTPPARARSSLSSSHATLSALLSGGTPGQASPGKPGTSKVGCSMAGNDGPGVAAIKKEVV